MTLHEEIRQVFSALPAEFSEKKGVFTVEYVLAERKFFLSRKKLVYILKYRIDEKKQAFRFTEMLKESGSGLSGGDMDGTAGFGFKKTTYRTGSGPREGTLEEQSNLFGQKYSYSFDFRTVRAAVEQKVREAGFTITYLITPIGL